MSCVQIVYATDPTPKLIDHHEAIHDYASSLLINSLENVNPDISPCLFNQNMVQKLPKKKMPSTTANAMRRSANVASNPMYFCAHTAFLSTLGIIAWAKNSLSVLFGLVMYMLMRRL